MLNRSSTDRTEEDQARYSRVLSYHGRPVELAWTDLRRNRSYEERPSGDLPLQNPTPLLGSAKLQP